MVSLLSLLFPGHGLAGPAAPVR